MSIGRMRARLGALVLLAASAVAGGAAAQETPNDGEESAAASRGAAFEAAEDDGRENVPGGLLMVVAYGIAGVLIFGYVGTLGFRQAATQRELARLEEDLKAYNDREGA